MGSEKNRKIDRIDRKLKRIGNLFAVLELGNGITGWNRNGEESAINMSRNSRGSHKSKGDQTSSKSGKDKSKKSGKKSSGNGDKEPLEEPPATTSEPSGGKCDTDIQSWSEIPSIAHFCSLFRQAFDLLEFDIQELEESLLLMNTDADESQLVLRLL